MIRSIVQNETFSRQGKKLFYSLHKTDPVPFPWRKNINHGFSVCVSVCVWGDIAIIDI